MFGFSLTKLAILALVIAALLYAPRLLRRLATLTTGEDEDEGPADEALATRKCPRCGDYVVAVETPGCGRSDCPYP